MREIWGNYSHDMNLADLHIHTTASFDGRRGMSPEQAVELGERIGLDSIAITDHDIFHPSIRAWNEAEKKGTNVKVVPGMEITSRQGHVLGLFLYEAVPPKMPLDETIQAIHAQGGIAIIPHPEFVTIQSVKYNVIEFLLGHPDPSMRPDRIEVFNGGVFDHSIRRIAEGKKYRSVANQKALQFYKEHEPDAGAAIASSDAHRKTLGRFITGYHGHLRNALVEQRTVALARNLTDVEAILVESQNVFGHDFDADAVRDRIDKIKPFEDQYFSYLGK